MAFQLNHDLLVRLGYRDLTRNQAEKLLTELYNAGQEIVGLRVGATMSEAQVEDFGRFLEAEDDAGALAWLERNMPDYKELVQDTFRDLSVVLERTAEQTRSPGSFSHFDRSPGFDGPSDVKGMPQDDELD